MDIESNRGKITLKDIADATGLSLNTVSKVLNHKPYYSEAAERKVLKAVDELGYIPNTLASSLRRGFSRTVAIVFDDLLNPYYSFMTLTIAQRLVAEKYDLTMFSTYGRSSYLDRTLLSKILSRKVDAVISFLEPEPDVVETIRRAPFPFVLLGRDMEEQGIDSIYSDDREGGRLATGHLAERGHRKIAYIGAHPGISADKMRFMGYRDALERYGIPFSPEYVGYFSDYGSVEALADRFLSGIDARAVFCFNDIFSFVIMRQLSSRGLKMPDDYALVGYDDIQKYLSLPTYLTTIGTENERMAGLAADVTLKKLANDPSYKSLLCNPHPVRLVLGQTT